MTLAQRIMQGAEAVFDIASAEVDRGVLAARSAGGRLAFRIVGLVLLTYAAIGVAGAIVLALLPFLGLVWSLAIVSVSIGLLGGAVCVMASAIGRKREAERRNAARIEEAKARLSLALDPPREGNGGGGPGSAGRDGSLREQFEDLVADPKVLTGAAFAAISILGPGRLLKAATRSAGAASAIAALASAIKSSGSRPSGH